MIFVRNLKMSVLCLNSMKYSQMFFEMHQLINSSYTRDVVSSKVATDQVTFHNHMIDK